MTKSPAQISLHVVARRRCELIAKIPDWTPSSALSSPLAATASAPSKPGHRTLGNLHTTLLQAHGRDIEHFGALDTGLDKFGIDQKGPIPELLRG
jgi:hypothetical protein